MGIGRFRLFKVLPVIGLLFLNGGGCTSTPISSPTVISMVGVKAELSSPKVKDGSILRVTIYLPPEIKSALIRGKFENNDLPFFAIPALGAGVYESVLGVPFNHPVGVASIVIFIETPDHTVRNLHLPVEIISGNYPEEILKVDPRLVKPSKKDLERIKKEGVEIKAIYRQMTAQKFWEGPFQLPIHSSIKSVYGTKRIYNGEMQSFHQGLDLKADEGTPILAAAPGKVVLAKYLFLTGNTVLLEHGYGVFTVYAHMSRLKVKKNQFVGTQELLGLSGKTGRVTGPHLHWGAVIHNTKVNPIELTTVMR